MKIKFKRVNKNAILPTYVSRGSVGADIFACVPGLGVHIAPGNLAIIPTGIIAEVPDTYELQIRSRSGLALRGVCVANSPGTIDSDFRGEIKILLQNLGQDNFSVYPGDRIAQMVLNRVARIEWLDSEELTQTERGEKGFGSTGLRHSDIEAKTLKTSGISTPVTRQE